MKSVYEMRMVLDTIEGKLLKAYGDTRYRFSRERITALLSSLNLLRCRLHTLTPCFDILEHKLTTYLERFETSGSSILGYAAALNDFDCSHTKKMIDYGNSMNGMGFGD